jgi:Tol biopolymer transport system component
MTGTAAEKNPTTKMLTASSTGGFGALPLFAAVALAALMAAGLLMLGKTKPAEAAFPGVNGLIAFTSNRITTANPTGDFEIYTMDPSNPSGTLTQLTDNTADDAFPAFSPNGQKIAFVSGRNGNYQIYTMDADGLNQTNNSNNAAIDADPAWSSDSQKIVFVSIRGSNSDSEIYTMDTNPATNDATQLTDNTARDEYPAWSPNGRKIAFASDRDGDFEIYTMKPNGSKQTRLTRNHAVDIAPNWSPGGKKIAFESDRNGFSDIFVMRAEGTRQRNLTKGAAFSGLDRAPAFSPEGTQIAFMSTRDGGDAEIYMMDADGTDQIRLTNYPGIDNFPDWQPT